MTSCTPWSPRAFKLRRNWVQNAPSSLSPTAKPSTSRRPSPHTPVATTTAWATTRRLTRALQSVASRNTYGKLWPASERSRNAATSWSRSAQMRLTSDLLMPLSAPRARTRSSTLRVETPCR
jgi:hypothetical protein